MRAVFFRLWNVRIRAMCEWKGAVGQLNHGRHPGNEEADWRKKKRQKKKKMRKAAMKGKEPALQGVSVPAWSSRVRGDISATQ